MFIPIYMASHPKRAIMFNLTGVTYKSNHTYSPSLYPIRNQHNMSSNHFIGEVLLSQ
jgi:hypothetical protein